MDQTISLQFSMSAILANVKSETFLSGQVEKAANEKAIAEAYHEQAGDEAYQTRLLNRGLYTNLSELETHLSDYLTSSGQSSADNITQTESGDIITLTLLVSDRFNKGYTDPLAKLCSKYIEEAMLMDWWKPINEKQSALYAQFVERDLAAIKRCFNKTAPGTVVQKRTTNHYRSDASNSHDALHPGLLKLLAYARHQSSHNRYYRYDPQNPPISIKPQLVPRSIKPRIDDHY